MPDGTCGYPRSFAPKSHPHSERLHGCGINAFWGFQLVIARLDHSELERDVLRSTSSTPPRFSAVMTADAVALATYPADHVELACSKCDRRGRYRKTSLVAIHGPEIGLTDLRLVS